MQRMGAKSTVSVPVLVSQPLLKSLLLLQLSEIVQACQVYSTEASRLQHADKQDLQQLFTELGNSLTPALQKAS